MCVCVCGGIKQGVRTCFGTKNNLEAGCTCLCIFVCLPNNFEVEELNLPGCNVMYSFVSQLTFRRKMLPSSSGFNSKPSRKPA